MPAAIRVARFADGARFFHALLAEDGLVREVEGDPAAGFGPPGPPHDPRGLAWLTPCVPSKIVCVGRNYAAHIAELRQDAPMEPLLFLKPPSALLPPGAAIVLPRESRRVDYEGELGIVIGRAARRVPEERALEHVLGYTCVNDVTARDLQEIDVQFTRSKGFDTFAPLGPCIAMGIEPERLVVETWVNGSRRQSAPVSRMIFGPARLISYISNVMTLLPGDVISTGTPDGVGPLCPGDEVSVVIEGIGRLTNRVEAPPS
ncbi:MAG TPA: fumarylacetoacetate hydrolase family protein [Candidatus Polarisedimenticolia bacterium]|nr:fumarylacetoacetate hydrolase family protein [Candidatus Polarisedimenticolia bacterium]